MTHQKTTQQAIHPTNQHPTQPIWLKAAALFAIIFGGLTIFSGSSVLLSNAAQQAAGEYVGFVVWFNVLAGVAYIVAGLGLWLGQRWAVRLALLIAVATLLVFGLFGLHILTGGAFESRTVAALLFRAAVWAGLFVLAQRTLKPANAPDA